MLKLPSLGEMDRALSVRIYLATGATDMRKGFDSLAALIRDALGHDPLSGSLFLFVGRSRDRLKILYWDSDGYAVWYKRLEEGTFRLPSTRAAGAASVGASVELKASELAMLLEGIDLGSIQRSRRFRRAGP
jgi:transposase